MVGRYIPAGNFQKNILIYHSGHTQYFETKDTSFESPDIRPPELVINVGVAVKKKLLHPFERKSTTFS